MPVALPLLKAEFDLTLFASSWLVSMFNVMALSCAMLFGLATDRIGAYRFCLAGLALTIAGSLAGSVAPSTTWLLASRVLEGAGFVAVVVSAPGLMAAATAPRERRLALGLWSTYMPVGTSLTLALAPLALATSGWRGMWVAVAVVTLATAAWLACHAGDYGSLTSGHRRSFADIRSALAQPVPGLLGISFAVYTLQFYAVMVWLPTYLLQTRGASAAQGALATTLFVAINIPGNLVGTRLVHREVPRGRIMFIAFVLIAVCAVAIFWSALPDSLRFAAALAFSLIAGVIPAAVLSAGSHYARSAAEVGTVQGMIVQVANLGIFLGPPAIAAVVTWTGRWEAALGVLLGSTVIGLAASWAISAHERAARQSTAAP
jgi:CP family cyanate transporter-like MFS transporter